MCHVRQPCRGRCTHALESERAAARSGQQPQAAVEGQARRGAWPWQDLGVPTSVTAAMGCLAMVL